MKIKGIEGMTMDDLTQEIYAGGKIVTFSYTISLIVVSIKKSTDAYFISKDENYFFKSLPFTILSLVFGWWGIPWGPIYTISSLIKNLSGGKDISYDVLNELKQSIRRAEDSEEAS